MTDDRGGPLGVEAETDRVSKWRRRICVSIDQAEEPVASVQADNEMGFKLKGVD